MKNTIKNKEEIDILFNNGTWLKTKNLKIVYKISNSFKYMVVAPIKLYKRAVDRNRIKRLLRNSISKNNFSNVSIAFIFNSDNIDNLKNIDFEISNILNKIK